jgi:ribosomal protein S18 acetylase RimI-like enzyme
MIANIEIRKVTVADISLLQDLGRQTFYETFAGGNTVEDMQKYLEESFSADKIAVELADPGSEFYFATLDNRVIGYLKINFGKAQTELKDENAIEIERIYVLKDFQGRHAGQILFEKALAVARKSDTDYVWLGVWEKNPKAISFYRRNGFEEFDRHIFRLGNDEQTDIMMKFKLRE